MYTFSWKTYFTNKGQNRILKVCVIAGHVHVRWRVWGPETGGILGYLCDGQGDPFHADLQPI